MPIATETVSAGRSIGSRGASGPYLSNTVSQTTNHFAVFNASVPWKTANLSNLQFTTNNSLALSILADTNTNNHTGNQTLDDLVNKGRDLLSGDYTWNPTDEYQWGSFKILNCGGSLNRIDEVASALNRMMTNLIDVTYEVKVAGVNSPYGFQALFQTQRRRAVIRRLYEQILTVQKVNWKDIRVPGQSTANIPQDPQPPQIYCLRPDVDDSNALDAYNECTADPGIIAMWTPGSTIISLCPTFFRIPYDPVPDYCPTFDGQGKISSPSNIGDLQFNQEAAILHELVHMYLPWHYVDEWRTLAGSLALSSLNQRRNPSNYAYFYSGKLALLFPFPSIS